MLMRASNEWARRPDDERYLNLPDMRDHFAFEREASRMLVVPSKKISLIPAADNKGLSVAADKFESHAPNHWSFGQLAALAEAPAGYLRTIPSPIVSDCLNYGLRFKRAIEDVGVLLYSNGHAELRAATGPNYGRVWNSEVLDALISRFGDGITGDWRVPGEFGKAVEVTRANTTLYAGDRDMFVFLADEKNRITVPNRRNGQSGSMARGFFLWNSEVGKTTLGIGTFLFDYVCCNRIVWGADAYQEIRVRHTSSAPLRWLDEVQPVLLAYSNASAKPIEDAIKAAQEKKVEDVDAFLRERFGKQLITPFKKVHELEEGRPIETIWDVTVAATAYARGVGHIDARVDLERIAGDVMKMAA